VAADFGSLAAELAVTRAAAGLADVSSIGKFDVRGTDYGLAAVYPSGRPLFARRPVLEDGVWWCPVASGQLLVLCSPAVRQRVADDLSSRTAGLDIDVADVTSSYAAMCVVGPSAGHVLSRAGLSSPPEGGMRTDAAGAGGIPVLVVRERRHRWLLVVPAGDAAELWHALSDAGGPVGRADVGADALHHRVAAGDR
jgi:glycine cleavage system aminomethyltransferase T